MDSAALSLIVAGVYAVAMSTVMIVTTLASRPRKKYKDRT